MIFGPMLQVGWASASSAVTSSSSSRVRPRNGPPEAVRTRESTWSGPRPSRHWKAAECSLSTGSSLPPPRACAARASPPAATRLSLFASARSTPRSSAQNVTGSPANPTTALSTMSGSARSSSSVGSPPTWVSGASPSIGDEPDAAATSSRPGMRFDDLDGLASDRARRTDQRDSPHGNSMPPSIQSHSSGMFAFPLRADFAVTIALGRRPGAPAHLSAGGTPKQGPAGRTRARPCRRRGSGRARRRRRRAARRSGRARRRGRPAGGRCPLRPCPA